MLTLDQAGHGGGDDFETLAAELIAAFAEGVDAPWTDERFDALALRVFAYQFRSNAVYRRFSQARSATPDTVRGWADVSAGTAGKIIAILSR
jgi:hypothetical protein